MKQNVLAGIIAGLWIIGILLLPPVSVRFGDVAAEPSSLSEASAMTNQMSVARAALADADGVDDSLFRYAGKVRALYKAMPDDQDARMADYWAQRAMAWHENGHLSDPSTYAYKLAWGEVMVAWENSRTHLRRIYAEE